MSPTIDIVVEDQSWKAIRNLKPLVHSTVEATLPALHRKKSLTILFADDATLKTLNHDWRGKNKPTNVLSFPASPNARRTRSTPKPLGDIALSFETVAREAEATGISLEDHTAHLIVHGVLHLLGYDHVIEDEANQMEAKEIRILKKLGITDPYQN